MTDEPNKHGDGLAGLFLKHPHGRPSEDDSQSANLADSSVSRAPTSETSTSSASGSVAISSLIPGGTTQRVPPGGKSTVSLSPGLGTQPSSTGPSPKVLALVEEVSHHLPPDSPTKRLMDTMASLASFIPDVDQRKNAALATLAGQGVTADSIAAGAKEVKRAIDSCLDGLLASAETVRQRDVEGKRTQASDLCEQSSKLNDQIEQLKQQVADLEQQAAACNTQALAREEELVEFKQNVETARVIARQNYSV